MPLSDPILPSDVSGSDLGIITAYLLRLRRALADCPLVMSSDPINFGLFLVRFLYPFLYAHTGNPVFLRW